MQRRGRRRSRTRSPRARSEPRGRNAGPARSAAPGWPRRGGRRATPPAPAGLGRELDRIVLGAVDQRAEELAAPAGWGRRRRVGSRTRGTRPEGSAAAASPSSNASTAARSPIPNGASRSRMSSAQAARRGSRSGPRPRAGARSHVRPVPRISSSATTIAACWTQSRSKSPSSPERRTTTSQASADPPRARPDGRAPGPEVRLRRDEGRRPRRAAAPRRESPRGGARGAGAPRARASRRERRGRPSCLRSPRRSPARSRRDRLPRGRAAPAARSPRSLGRGRRTAR